RANASLVGGSIAPTLRRRILTIVSQSHATYRDLGSDAFCQLKGIIGRFQASIACAFPFVRIAQPLALGLTQLGGFLGLHPYHRVVTGNIRELKLINAGLAVLGTLVRRIVERCHEFRTADALESWVTVRGTAFLHSHATLFRRHRMTRDRGVALADDSRPSKDRADFAHLRISQSMHLLELKEQPLILLGERVL